ncbi:2-oxo-tetronate isomerase [Roseateles violae]|uniref:TIM barrel protein n=1 Tax=Roseateles violae TaxID=3058042 RepID=A0ABT8DSR1_9BURK|nr:2-oxo-tetronate isomerase [Pelomonas sp. PFR6]MDN3921018.1 TIM barrel protein [Pelomonas sp. PFR6]
MPRFAANLSLLYMEHAFADRFEAAARDGFEAVEILFPYEHPAAEVAALLQRHGLQAVLINAPPGDFAAGERGLACLPGREAEFRASVEQALAYARAIACPRVHIMSGIVARESSRSVLKPLWLDNLRWAAEAAARMDLRLCIEPINARDMPGYFLNRQDQALELLAALAAPNVGLQMDWYHCQIVEGDVATKLRRAIAAGVLEHVQLAGVPDRQEPDEGELRVDYLLDLLDRLGYAGHVGCEYRPRAGTSAGLAWLQRFIDGARQ